MILNENYFIFNDFDSRDYGILVEEEPTIIKAGRKYDTVKIDGRDGFLLYDNGEVYDSFTLTIECNVEDGVNIDEICKVFNGYGQLVLSSNPDRYYNAFIANQVDFGRVFRTWKSFAIVFECQPYAYEIKNTMQTYTFSGANRTVTINNKTNATSKPLITVYGNGEISMAINGEIINLIVDDYITLDFDLENATKGTLNRNNCVEGEYTSFKSGINTITVSSLATKIEITPNFRWY